MTRSSHSVAFETCPDCDGNGEHVEEPGGWWHGSGVFTKSYECPTCNGVGEVEA